MLILHIALGAVALFIITGSLLNLTKHPHWFIRAWDFPRVFVAIVSFFVAVAYGYFFHDNPWDIVVVVALVVVIFRQVYMIFPYIPGAPKKVLQAENDQEAGHQLTLLMTNVLMENEEYDKWLQVVRDADPDIIVAVETNQKWHKAIAALDSHYPFCVKRPLDNYYGMELFSRLEFDGEPEVRFLVQDDIPSIHLSLFLKDGQSVRVHALHPRPPEPIFDQDSAPRDAELVIMGREISEKERSVPTIVCGDLNDVAWSFTTQLFLRLSKLLDPRMGRGLFNSYNANSRIFRYPLDHVFHSNEFKLVDLRVLEHVGSDHFPVLIRLSCEQEAVAEQEETEAQKGDQKAADELVEEEAKREVEGKEDGHVSDRIAHV